MLGNGPSCDGGDDACGSCFKLEPASVFHTLQRLGRPSPVLPLKTPTIPSGKGLSPKAGSRTPSCELSVEADEWVWLCPAGPPVCTVSVDCFDGMALTVCTVSGQTWVSSHTSSPRSAQLRKRRRSQLRTRPWPGDLTKPARRHRRLTKPYKSIGLGAKRIPKLSRAARRAVVQHMSSSRK